MIYREAERFFNRRTSVLVSLGTAASLALAWVVAGGLPTRGLPSGVVRSYLAQNVVRPELAGGRVFCMYDSLGARHQGVSRAGEVTEYVYALCQEYSRRGGRLEAGAGARLPVALTARFSETGYEVVGHREALDSFGDREIFPPLVLWHIRRLESGGDDLGAPLAAEARAYFGP